MKRCVIIGGADINNYGFIKENLSDCDFFIYCDSGLRHMESLEKMPNLIVGDFDSHKNPELNVETIVLPCEKDDTDTYFAVKEAVKRGFDDFVLIGAVGGRLDHTLGNVSILLYLNSLGKSAKIIDEFSEMQIADGETVFVDDSYSYFSLINISGEGSGIYVKNAKYPLCNATITPEYQYGISNETLSGKKTEIKIENGRMLLIKVR